MTVVEDTRTALGRVGAMLPVIADEVPIDTQRDAVRRLDAVGYPSAWTNEAPGKDALVQLGVLLAATERLVFGTCIANIWNRPPQTMHAAAGLLAAAYPGRFVLGLGVGHPQQAEAVGATYGRPLTTMREYLTASGAATYPRVVAANRPRMLALAAELSDGALPATSATEATAAARAAVGPEKLLVVYLDVSSGAGTADAVADVVLSHLSAGADHVIAGCPYGSDFATSIDRLIELAPLLLT